MSDKINDGGPAFARSGANIINADDYVVGSEGMRLRDYFAAKAMQGMVASGCTIDVDKDIPFLTRATTAYAIADAMLRAREHSHNTQTP